MVKNNEIYWWEKLKLHKESVLFIILKQGKNFKSFRFVKKSQEKKIKNVKIFKRHFELNKDFKLRIELLTIKYEQNLGKNQWNWDGKIDYRTLD